MKLWLKDVRKYDLSHDDCLIRVIEMTVDSVLNNHPYTVQFWRDFELYGADEALTYMKNTLPENDYEEIVQAIETAKEKVHGVRICDSGLS